MFNIVTFLVRYSVFHIGLQTLARFLHCVLEITAHRMLDVTRGKLHFSMFSRELSDSGILGKKTFFTLFQHSQCVTQSDNTIRGTCMSSTDCDSKSGVADGTCASGDN